jgi:hypothetical protein
MRISLLCLTLAFVLVACNPTVVPGESSFSSAQSSSVSSVALNLYEDSGIGYSINIPADWTTLEDKEVITAGYEVKGTAFVAPMETTGTALNEAYFHVAQIGSCPKVSAPESASGSVVIAGVTFQRTNWSEGAAGNLYEGITYAGLKDAGCLVLTGYLHSCNLGVDCGENHSAPFNKQAYLSTFDAMAKSVQFLAHPGD